MSLKPAIEFSREIAVRLTPGQPVFIGHSVAVTGHGGQPVIITAPSKKALIDQVAVWFPNLELDHNHIYHTGLIHRQSIHTASDAEEL